MQVRSPKTYLIFLGLLISLFLSTYCTLAAAIAPVTSAGIESPGSEPTQSNVVEAACELIYEGKFDLAGKLIAQFNQDHQGQLEQLEKIVQEYQTISQNRQSARQVAYTDSLAELDKFRASGSTKDVNDVSKVLGDDKSLVLSSVPEANELAAEPPDINDVNNVSKILSVIAKACEFADQKQKSGLLSDSFVEQTIQKAINRAAEFESKSKWFDAYITCYRWLQAIDKDNKAYSDYAEKLLDKGNIVASFQDSDCETRKERFQDVRKDVFIEAINNVLDSGYVSKVDYHQMAIKAIRHCELLAEVVAASFFDILESLTDVSPSQEEENPLVQPDSNELSAWSAGLKSLLDEVDQSPQEMGKGGFIDVFEKILALNTTTVKLPERVLIAHFAEAALSALDSYTVMVWPKQVPNFKKLMTSEFEGIGVQISKEKGLLTAQSLLFGTPAYQSGLDAGDVIVKVDGAETKNMSIQCAVEKIMGPAGTDVRLTIRRPGEEQTRDIIITRAKITVPTICGWQRTGAGKWLYMIDDKNKIGHIRITNFSEDTASDLEKVLDELEAEGLKGLILDLRQNSGGLLDSAIQVSDKFIEGGPIVSTRPRSIWRCTYARARKRGTHPNYPLVVLIDPGSASASEIVAGALGDQIHDRAILVGNRTHGKGSVQGIAHFKDGGAKLKYTMAHYHLPSGQRVESRDVMKKQGRDDWGVGPDIKIKLRSDEFRKMIEAQRENDVLVRADHDNEAAPLKRHTVEQTLASDPQLAVGVLVIKTKLIQEAERNKLYAK